MTKLEIFDDVVSVMKHDASCCKDEPGGDVEYYRAQISEDMDENAFVYVMKSYLATFHVMSHVYFDKKKYDMIPFRVQRYKNVLYVRAVTADSPLSVGDRIIKVDGCEIDTYAMQHEEMFYGETEERQNYGWQNLLCFAKEVTVEKAGTGEVKVYPIALDAKWDNSNKYICKTLREGVTYLRLKDFQNEEEIQKLYTDNHEILYTCDYLIIDVRSNGGGCDTAFFPLFELCLPEGKTIDDMADDIYDGGAEINYSERNCDVRKRWFAEYMKMELPQETRAILQKMEADLDAYRGKGFVKVESEDIDIPYTGLAKPYHVYIITDSNCGSSGDAFVDIMRKSDKVTVVGRPTMGILDFSNCAMIEYDQFEFMYPTSRNLYLDKGIQMRNHGIPVDVYVPWTPEHLKRDVDLEKVFELIGANKG